MSSAPRLSSSKRDAGSFSFTRVAPRTARRAHRRRPWRLWRRQDDADHRPRPSRARLRHRRDGLPRPRHARHRAVHQAADGQARFARAARAPRPPPDEVSEGSGNWQLPPERLGGPPLPDAELRPAVIVFPDVDPDRTDVAATPVSPARAAFVLGEQSSAMWAIEPRPLAAIARLVTAVPAFQVSYGNAFDAAPVIINELMDAPPPPGLEPPSRHPRAGTHRHRGPPTRRRRRLDPARR